MAARAAHKGRNVAQGASKVEVERAAVRLETHDHEARVLFRLATSVGALVHARRARADLACELVGRYDRHKWSGRLR